MRALSLKARGEAWSSLVTSWMGDRFMLGVVHQLLAISLESKLGRLYTPQNPLDETLNWGPVCTCMQIRNHMHVKAHVVRFKVRWSIETQIYPSCTIATKYCGDCGPLMEEEGDLICWRSGLWVQNFAAAVPKFFCVCRSLPRTFTQILIHDSDYLIDSLQNFLSSPLLSPLKDGKLMKVRVLKKKRSEVPAYSHPS